jgi:Tfp pilus assembly protein PilZ
MNMQEKRATDRFKPVKAITVAVESEDGLPAGFGIVADISEGGACVITDVGLFVGANVRLALSFPNHRTPISTPGKLRWIQQDPNSKNIRYGMKFEPGPWTDEGKLKSLIAEHAAA